MYNVVAPTLVAMARNLGKFWLFFDKIACKSACMPDRPDMFGPTRGDDQGADLCCHGNDIALSTESNRLPACTVSSYTRTVRGPYWGTLRQGR